ncbi:SMC-Scp complex subunit ScpB [Protaetiibacter sp. SSC-01]|uniref:SMC-Scp complex subunit ScpB n=1 Tax=Protaetiibacter sp. SSC-01 TaxID=2759943 RepID=UPI00165753D0|nr:SMC-Scp complex subunit ScpB [Protaetiibacter sp. SSC-01]QNO36554.1 SMC-Scp complex subunit ScpB [Protaetiibacter sp. SSC-01]
MTDEDLDTPASPALDQRGEAPASPARDQRGEADLERRLEAIMLVADEPLPLVTLATALGAPVPAVRQSLERLVADYDGESGGPRRGFELREVGGGWRLYVRAEHDDLVRDFVLTQSPTKLSQAALETLAVIAYKQPIARSSIAAIRAVNVDSVVRTLLGRGLITEAYTDAETGAIHYETTPLLLTQLGINSLDELPPISPLLPDGVEGFEELGAR